MGKYGNNHILNEAQSIEQVKGENGKITLPPELQKQMMKFFLKTSIPRIKAEKEKHRA